MSAPGPLRTAARPVERACWAVAAGLVAVGLAHLAVQAVLGGPWEGPVSWRKPTTFGLSFGITLASVAWAASFLTMRERLRTALLGALAVASVGEVALVTVQAWRGVPSHFNVETALDATVARGLAAGGAVLVVVLTTLFALSLRPQPGVAPERATALRWGFGALVGALAVGAAMIAVGMLLVAQGDPQAAYAQGGALKLAHFAAMHGVPILPGLAWLAGRSELDATARRRAVHLGVAGYGTAVAAVLVALTVPVVAPLAWAAVTAGGAALAVAAGRVVLATAR